MSDGTVLDPRPGPAPTSAQVRGEFLRPIAPKVFPTCPICLSSHATEAEHVPPKALGGREATRTCRRCNNRFGQLEASLADHYRGVLRARFSGGPVPGLRAGGKAALRHLGDGEFALLIDGPTSDPALTDIFRSGAFILHASEPDEASWRTALLKSAYLAACLVLGEIPVAEQAAAMRAELIAAADDPGVLAAGAGPHAKGLIVLRLFTDPPYPLYAATVEREGTIIYGFGLGRFGFVSWPLPDVFVAASAVYQSGRH